MDLNARKDIAKLTRLIRLIRLKGEASLTRIHLTVMCIADGKVLAEGVQYLRAGGDLIVIGHHTQSACPNESLIINRKVFI